MVLNRSCAASRWREQPQRGRRVLALLIVCLLAASCLAPLRAQQASVLHTSYVPVVSTPPPPYSTSYYIESINPDFFPKLGCAAAAELAERRISEGVVVLFFGRPAYQETAGYGTQLLGQKRSVASIAQLQAAAVGWITGYLNGYSDAAFRCKRPAGVRPRLTLAVATTNEPLYIQIPMASTGSTTGVVDPDPDMQSHGSAWAHLVNCLGDYVAKNDPQQRLSVAGANDIEFAWNTAQQTKLWVNGYTTLAKYRYYNVGSCDACPEQLADAPRSGPYAFGWTANDIWSVSALKGTQVLPQSYNELGAQARQWATLAEVTADLGTITFAGALTQYYACEDQQKHDTCLQIKNRPTVGWQQLEQALKEQRISARLTWSTDVRWNFDETPFAGGSS